MKKGDLYEDVGSIAPGKVFREALKDGDVADTEILEVLSRLKEGGAYVKFRHSSGVDADTVASAVRK